MNRHILRHYINEYKLNFDKVNKQEIYKWKAVKCFQDNWDINADNFFQMLENSLRMVGNLMDSGNYFPKRMLLNNTKKEPTQIKNLFINLYNEEEDLYSRITEFRSQIKKINDANFTVRHNYQDPRAIIVYLTLRYPERYFFYKFEMFKQFSKKLDLTYRPVKGHIENIGHFNSQSELIRYELSLDQELLKLHKNRITNDCYYDEYLNILTQDFIYAVVKHLEQTSFISTTTEIETKETNALSIELTSSPDNLSFRGRTINFIQNGIENKRLGDLGELWVMKYEIKKLEQTEKNKWISNIKHISKDEGDGTGFDIQSVDSDGSKIYIEVKTTKGNKNSTFFVTRNELERSKKENDKYYLYRLYNYNEQSDTADLFIIKGDLTNLCEFPITYKVNLTND